MRWSWLGEVAGVLRAREMTAAQRSQRGGSRVDEVAEVVVRRVVMGEVKSVRAAVRAVPENM